MSNSKVSLVPRPSSKEEGGSGEYSADSHHGLAIAMDSAFKVAFWASANWRCVK